jgi:hypothetical protein
VVEFLIDRDGQPVHSWDFRTLDAVVEHGFIHVALEAGTVIVFLYPKSTHGIALAGAFDEIARLDPRLVLLKTDPETPKAEVFRRHAEAFRRMWDLVAAEGNVAAYPRDQATNTLIVS